MALPDGVGHLLDGLSLLDGAGQDGRVDAAGRRKRAGDRAVDRGRVRDVDGGGVAAGLGQRLEPLSVDVEGLHAGAAFQAGPGRGPPDARGGADHQDRAPGEVVADPHAGNPLRGAGRPVMAS